MKQKDLKALLNRASAALETPKDLSLEDMRLLAEDLIAAANEVETPDVLEEGKRIQLFCRDGHEIHGTLEMVYGVALIDGATYFGPGEEPLELNYTGGTDIDWDSQEPVLEELERVFCCSEGHQHRESTLVKKEYTDAENQKPNASVVDSADPR